MASWTEPFKTPLCCLLLELELGGVAVQRCAGLRFDPDQGQVGLYVCMCVCVCVCEVCMYLMYVPYSNNSPGSLPTSFDSPCFPSEQRKAGDAAVKQLLLE